MKSQLRLIVGVTAVLAAIPLALTGCSAAPPATTPKPTAAATQAPIDPVKAPDETTSGFTLISDDSGHVQVSVPTTWTDVDGASIAGPKDTTLLNVAASPDLNGFINGYDVPGVSVTLTNDPTLTGQDFLDSIITSVAPNCDDGETGDYDDTLYVGTYMYLPNCGGNGTDFLTVVATNPDGVLAIITIQMVSDEDKSTIRDEILQTFNAI